MIMVNVNKDPGRLKADAGALVCLAAARHRASLHFKWSAMVVKAF